MIMNSENAAPRKLHMDECLVQLWEAIVPRFSSVICSTNMISVNAAVSQKGRDGLELALNICYFTYHLVVSVTGT